VKGNGVGKVAAPEKSAAPLQRYRDKRDPRTSNEPFGPERIPSAHPAKPGTWHGDFVVHLHDATRRHYDLRLQVAGRLLSFAVPRGPTLNPADKHLAVQTEDHPIEYLDFEDVIPEGNYGAGAMIVWDIGRVTYLEHSAEDGLDKGKLDFLLFGRKLQGRFALVETGKRQKPPPKQRQWLLLKKTDAHASATVNLVEDQPHSVFSSLTVEQLAERERVAQALIEAARALGAKPGRIHAERSEPMLCSDEGATLTQRGYIYELKIDGVRILADKREDRAVLRYRRSGATTSYPEIARAVRALAPKELVLDGEIVAFDTEGRPSFQRLAQRIHAQRPHDIKRASIEVPVTYFVFDLLQVGELDLRPLPLHVRKQLLAQLIPGKGFIRLLDHIDDGEALFKLCEAQGLEGVIAKRRDSAYQPGPRRTTDWVKIKRQHDDDFVVVGWTSGQGTREQLGSLEIATFDGQQFRYRGRVGSGLDGALIDRLLADFRKIERESSVAIGKPIEDGSTRHFVEPKLVISVRYLHWTDDGRLRQPVFRGIRPDVAPEACRAAPEEERIEQALHEAPAGPPPGTDEPAGVQPGTARSRATRVKLSNQDKIFWPEEGYTKGDLLHYYETIADVMLPHLEDRPVMLVRYPDGIAGKSFYQWNVPQGTPSWLRTLQLRNEEEDGKEVTTFLLDDVDSLLHVINLGCIPLHVLAAREQTLQECDFLTLDLDPGEQPFSIVVRLTLAVKEILDEVGLTGFVKTSGQVGIHVFVPLGPGVAFEIAKSLADLLGRLLQMRHPDVSTMERHVESRKGRLYIDTGQTGRSRTIVAPYSVRAYPGATVSTPLTWDEVHLALNPRELTLFSVPERAREHGDPMRALLDVRPNLPHAIDRLQKLFGL
jgi:bifunctional non-homologous end joining protein LigD